MIPTLFTKSEEVRNWRTGLTKSSTLALVPTMGALHVGHEMLMRKAKSLADNTIVTIFVNPLQFGDSDDLATYPRTLDKDVEICRRLGISAIFAPTVDEIIPKNSDPLISSGPLGNRYEGEHRPGHFDGVVTVVDRFFRMAAPGFAVFGMKDYQQLVVIRQMSATRHPDIDVIGVPTVRDGDGLAISSRNIRLTATDRHFATKLIDALRLVENQFRKGLRDPSQLEATGRDYLGQFPQVLVDYLVCVDSESLSTIGSIMNPAVVLLAATIGGVRLIDNILLSP